MPPPSTAAPEAGSVLQTISIIGTGLIGGSFALALRKAGFSGVILGIDEPPYLEAALAVGAIDQKSTLEEAAAVSDVLYLSGTVDQICNTIRHLSGMVGPGCLVTDVGSTKLVIEQEAKQYLPPGSFVGGHPMAGKEKRGAASSDPDLFRGRPYVLTSFVSTPVFAAFTHWLERIGTQLVYLDAITHDRAVAYSSHLPQILSTALAFHLSKQKELPISAVFGSGLIDMTRLALSAPGLWESILNTNCDNVVSAIDTYVESLNQVREMLLAGKLSDVFADANRYAYLLRDVPLRKTF